MIHKAAERLMLFRVAYQLHNDVATSRESSAVAHGRRIDLATILLSVSIRGQIQNGRPIDG